MGYYSGNGETTGGGSTTRPFQQYIWNGHHTAYQTDKTVVTRKAGVSLSTAQNTSSSCSLSLGTFSYGSSTYYAPGINGSQTDVNYSQINGSNLYELTVTAHTFSSTFV